MVMQAIGSAFKKMSQRAMWRGDRGQSQMIESHGLAGVRSNLLKDTPTYKKEAIGLNSNGGGVGFGMTKNKSTSANTKIKPNINTNSQNKNLGSSILGSLGL